MLCPLEHGESSEVLLDYCARKLDAAMLVQLERHIAHCPECARFAGAQKRVWEALDAWEAPDVSEEFDARLYARIAVQGRRGWAQRLFGESLAWRPALPFAAACAAVALALMLHVPGRNPAAPTVQERNRIESLEAEQIERALEDVEMLRQFSTPGGSQTF